MIAGLEFLLNIGRVDIRPLDRRWRVNGDTIGPWTPWILCRDGIQGTDVRTQHDILAVEVGVNDMSLWHMSIYQELGRVLVECRHVNAIRVENRIGATHAMKVLIRIEVEGALLRDASENGGVVGSVEVWSVPWTCQSSDMVRNRQRASLRVGINVLAHKDAAKLAPIWLVCSP